MSLSRFFPCFQFRLEDNVNKLDYSNNIFTDGFPHVWQYERTLEELNVASTRINYLPPQLFYCQGLKILLANNNNLENIPEAIGSLRQLQQLNLSRNFIANVPDNIKSCKNLTHLDLSCNSLQKLPDAITCLISLQEIILNETYLEFLPANFGRLVNLRIVELRSNNLVSLPKSMQRLTSLQRLDIGCNDFRKMPEVVGELKQLRELWFDFNQIHTLPIQIGKLRELEHCESNGNCLNNIPNEIGNWLNIEVLSLSMNNLTTFPVSIGMLKTLVTLKCESNELTELPGCISNLENLEELVVSHNKLLYLPSTLGMLRKLRYLFADDNNLQKLPDEICSCSVLTVISVSQNKLSVLPDNVGHLTNLKVLNIVQNNISTLPVSLLSLINLTSLWISNNQSQPLIPLQYTEIANKTHLTCFMLPQIGIKHKVDTLNRSTGNNLNIEQHTDKSSASAISKRRICFSEETTILHTPQISQLSTPTYCENGNYFVLSNTNNSISKDSAEFCRSSETKLDNVNSKDCLMRSPTPYPKELRLMSKYVQINHQKSLNSCNTNNYTDHKPNSVTEITSSKLENDSSCSYNKYNLQALDKNKIYEKHNFYHETANNDTNLEHSNDQYNQNIDKDRNRKMFTELATESSEQNFISLNSMKPPPYHIARCFTKKSAEDLTKYDFTRKQRHLHISNPYDDNNTLQEIDTVPKCEVTPNDHNNFECENNLKIQQFGEKHEPEKYSTGNEGTETVEPVITVCENKFLPQTYSPEISNAFAKRKCNKSRTKWLFGAHKNPRVIQVNVNWESGTDFEVDFLPNKEGIFVVSTVPGSNSSQVIHPLDKLLEVEGVDFTNIGIIEARKVLQNSRPSISIMLSRK